MIDLNSTTRFSDKVNHRIDTAITLQPEDEPRRYIGGSSIGDPCARKIYYGVIGAESSLIPPRTRRIFWRGHAFEDMALKWLRDAEFQITSQQATIRYGEIKGHIDGLILDSCGLFPTPCLWEHKALGSSSWKDLEKNRLKKYKYGATYMGQVSVYMAALNLTHTMFTATNADTMEMYHELIPVDLTLAEELKGKAKWIRDCADMGETPPRITTDKSYFLCKGCKYYKICWE